MKTLYRQRQNKIKRMRAGTRGARGWARGGWEGHCAGKWDFHRLSVIGHHSIHCKALSWVSGKVGCFPQAGPWRWSNLGNQDKQSFQTILKKVKWIPKHPWWRNDQNVTDMKWPSTCKLLSGLQKQTARRKYMRTIPFGLKHSSQRIWTDLSC